VEKKIKENKTHFSQLTFLPLGVDGAVEDQQAEHKNKQKPGRTHCCVQKRPAVELINKKSTLYAMG
jgi:hypothetical protein